MGKACQLLGYVDHPHDEITCMGGRVSNTPFQRPSLESLVRRPTPGLYVLCMLRLPFYMT